MPRDRWLAIALSAVVLGRAEVVRGQSMNPVETAPSAQSESVTSVEQLLRMSPEQLECLYRGSAAAPLPAGRVKGRAILKPGTRFTVPAAKVTRLVWQGKVIHPDGTSAVNRFFGVRAVKARVECGPSWLDGNPSLILDYHDTSLVYRRYRDEIRKVGPGIYLGLMYARSKSGPELTMCFVLEAPARCN